MYIRNYTQCRHIHPGLAKIDNDLARIRNIGILAHIDAGQFFTYVKPDIE